MHCLQLEAKCHSERRRALHSLLEATKTTVGEVRRVSGLPKTVSHVASMGTPIARMSWQDSAKLSYIDYIVTNSINDKEIKFDIDWNISISDHAVITFEVPFRRRLLGQKRPTWKPGAAAHPETVMLVQVQGIAENYETVVKNMWKSRTCAMWMCVQRTNTSRSSPSRRKLTWGRRRRRRIQRGMPC